MFKYLETFKVVYETKHFSKAAELLFIAQPTVSAQIKQLEADLGVALFIRNGRQEIETTPQGDLLYQKSVNLLDEWRELKSDLQHEKNQMTHCVIGASHTYSIYVLPDLIIQLKRVFPKLSITIKLMNSLAVVEALNRHEIDFGFIEKPLSMKHMHRFPLVKDQLVIVGNPEIGPWLVREETSGVYYYTQRYIEEHDIKQEQVSIHNNEIIVALLKKGYGCSIISERAAQGLDYKLLSEKYQRHFYLITRDQESRDELSKLVTWIRQQARDARSN